MPTSMGSYVTEMLMFNTLEFSTYGSECVQWVTGTSQAVTKHERHVLLSSAH